MVCQSYFQSISFKKGLFYTWAVIYVACVAVVVTVEGFYPVPCPFDRADQNMEFANALFEYNPCRIETRHPRLLFLTPLECSFGRHLVMAAILGSIIGYERRTPDRPAGIRTMSLVALGSCLFTIDSMWAFTSGSMSWDGARVSAAIPSGVGFLGAGLIMKDLNKDGDGHPIIKGINTAASVWLSAAVGVACGGGLYFPAVYTTALVLCLLRFGPRSLVRNHSSVLGINEFTKNIPRGMLEELKRVHSYTALQKEKKGMVEKTALLSEV